MCVQLLVERGTRPQKKNLCSIKEKGNKIHKTRTSIGEYQGGDNEKKKELEK